MSISRPYRWRNFKIILGWIWWCFTRRKIKNIKIFLKHHHQIQPNIILTMFHYKPTTRSLNFFEGILVNNLIFLFRFFIKFIKTSKIVYCDQTPHNSNLKLLLNLNHTNDNSIKMTPETTPSENLIKKKIT